MDMSRFCGVVSVTVLTFSIGFVRPATAQDAIVHDAEYYVLVAQNGERWVAEDRALDEKLAFDPLEYVEHLDQLPFDPSMDPHFGE